MKRFLIVLLAFALVAGLAFAGGNKDAEKTWTITGGGVDITGKVNLGVDGRVDLPPSGDYWKTTEPSVSEGDINGNFGLTMEKELKLGTFGLEFGLKRDGGMHGVKAVAKWSNVELGDGKLTTSVGFNQTDKGEGDYGRFDIRFGYAADTYGANLSFQNGSANGYSLGNTTFASLRGDWGLGDLNGWFTTMDGQLGFYVRYNGHGDKKGFFDLGHKVVAGTWDEESKALLIIFEPTFLEGLTVGAGIQNIGNGGRALDQIVYGLIGGVRYKTDSFGAMFVFDNGQRGYWGDINDDPNWLALKGDVHNTGGGANIQLGVDVKINDELWAALDASMRGLNNIDKYGYLGLGLAAGFDNKTLDAGLTLKMYASLKDKSHDLDGVKDAALLFHDRGVFAIKPNVGFVLIPDTLKVKLGMEILLFLGEEDRGVPRTWQNSTAGAPTQVLWKDTSSFNVNPSISWNPDGNSKVSVDLGWSFTSTTRNDERLRATTAPTHAKAGPQITKNELSLGFHWKF